MNTPGDKRKTPTLKGNPIQETYHVREAMELLPYLVHVSSRSRSSAKQLLSAKRVLVNSEYISQATHLLSPRDVVQISRVSRPEEFNHPKIKILWEDSDYVVIEKLYGQYTVDTTGKYGDRTAIRLLSNHYKKYDPDAKLFMVNRLDRETSGIVIFAKGLQAKELIISSWNKIVQEQIFVAAVGGVPAENKMQISTLARNKEDSSKKQKSKSETRERNASVVELSLLRTDGESSVVRLNASLGRIFSLRQVLANKGLVIMGDKRNSSPFTLKDRIALEQISLVFTHPKTGKRISLKRSFPTHLFGYLKNRQSDNQI
ncbi:pseudouridine synthase [Porphyromonas sp. COT-108 OH1349]|uniref:pseudouridine synthase n=1 Tax=Porphyromonas sp. COT-108 OH1349 TaxID=1537504 RepID=UPI000690F728|nr:pseudouridine synthase [Porphyromonas sp. COT-108 OH1349]